MAGNTEDLNGTHPEHEDFPWTIAVVDHPSRTDSPAYRASRALMIKLVDSVSGWTFGDAPFEDHHGGGIWVKDDDGWMCLLALAGIEWSAQFCADPSKVDRLRLAASRLLRAFPDTLDGYRDFGYDAADDLLATPITTADQVAAWTDSIFNASVPLPRGVHTGTLPSGAGYHHYPKPIVDIEFIKHDDFELFVTDEEGHPMAVLPVGRRGSGDGRVQVIAVHPGSRHAARLAASAARHEAYVAPADSPVARAAFRNQT